jgi:molybdenum cofactor biosynthesis enzyme MoaA
MKIILNIKENKVDDLLEFIKKNNIEFDLIEQEDSINEELKQALFEVKLIKRGILKEKTLSDFIDEL